MFCYSILWIQLVVLFFYCIKVIRVSLNFFVLVVIFLNRLIFLLLWRKN